MKAWVLAQLSWNPQQDLWTLVEEFARYYYDNGAPYLLEWLRYLNRQVQEDHSKCMDLYSGLEPGYLTPAVRQNGWVFLQNALNSVPLNSIFYKRIEIHLVGLLYSDLLVWVSDVPTSLKDLEISKTSIQEKYEKYLNLCKKYNITHLAEAGGFESFRKKIEEKLR